LFILILQFRNAPEVPTASVLLPHLGFAVHSASHESLGDQLERLLRNGNAILEIISLRKKQTGLSGRSPAESIHACIVSLDLLHEELVSLESYYDDFATGSARS
jgi:hypothetical protein